MDLKRKSLNALIWSFVDSFGVYFVRFGFTIAIARQLAPRDYGLAGMIAIFIALATLITESGFSMALIQKKNSNQKDYSTVFVFNLVASVILYVVLYFTAGFIANFYNEPIVKEITRVAALGIILSALITVQIAILNKKLEFKIPAFIRMASALTSGILGVILAYKGFGVWSLVYPTLVGSILSALLFWKFNKWRPSFVFSIESFKSLYKYGINIFAQGFTSILLDQIYYPLIGKFYNSTELGFFSTADRFYQIFVRRITKSYGRVAFPAFSSIQDKPREFATAYRKTTISLAFILIPLTALLIVSAKPVILILLTDKWEASIPYLQLLYLDGFFFPFYIQNQNLLCAIGKSNLSLRVDLLMKIVIILGVFSTFQIGIKALIISKVLSTIIGLIYGSYCLSKSYKLDKVVINIFQIIFLTVFCVFCSILAMVFFNDNLIILLIQLISFIAYFILSKFLRINGYKYFLSFFEARVSKKIRKYF